MRELSANMRHTSDLADQVQAGNGFFVLVPLEELPQFERLVPAEIRLFGVQEVTSNKVIVVDQGSVIFLTAAAPTSCLALVAISQEGYTRIARAAELLSIWSGNEFLRPVRIDAKAAQLSISSSLLGLLIERFALVSRQCVTYAADLSRLRAAHEDLQNNFAALETFVAAANVQPMRLNFSNPPANGSFVGGSGLTEVRQVLPISTLGLCSVDVHLGKLDPQHRYGSLEIALTTLEEQSALAEWHLNAERFVTGWINLGLPKALGGIERTPILTVRVSGGLGQMPPLSLGSPQPLKAFRAQISPKTSAAPAASLAIRCWSGLAGVTPPNISLSLDHLRPRRSAVRRVAIPHGFLRAAEWLPTGWSPDFLPVTFIENENAVGCHPPPEGITVAALPEMSLTEISRIEARVHIRHEQSSAIEFALLFSDMPPARITHALQYGLGSDLFFSGWVTASWSQPASLSCVSSATGKGRVFLATRVPSGNSNEFAWAAFRDLHITLLGLSTPKDTKFATIGNRAVSQPNTRNHPLAADFQRLRTPELTKSASVRLGHAADEVVCEFHSDGYAAAVIPHVRVRQLTHLSVKVTAGRANSAPIDVGVAVSDHRLSLDVEPDKIELLSEATLPFVFSGWQHLLSGDEIVLDLEVADLFSDFVSLHLVARYRGDVTSDLEIKSTAVFSAFEMLDEDSVNA